MSSNEDSIFKVQTVPPPPGETDAYSAPTKVGAMAAAIVEETILHAQRRADSASMKAAMKAARLHPLSFGLQREEPSDVEPVEADAKVTPFTLPHPAEPIITSLPVATSGADEAASAPDEQSSDDDDDTSLEGSETDATVPANGHDTASEHEHEHEHEHEASGTGGALEAKANQPSSVRAVQRKRPSAVPILLFTLALISFALYLVRRH